jgi:Outer membrane protein beta-barrel family/Carboxypeptidase regulatory-like domain
MKYFYTLLMLLSINAFTQKISLKGKILDEKTKTPVAFATVSLLNIADSSFVKGDLTDTLGRYELVGLTDGSYFISVSSVEFKPFFKGPIEVNPKTADLEPILMQTDEKLLSEVKVTATKQAFEQKFGNFIINVDSKVFKTSVDAVDVLKRSPGVIIDGSGNITYRQTSPKLLFDGKDLRMSAEQEKAYLRTLTPEMIETIELMPSPPAKYESAWQTIINIKLKRDKTLGYVGSIFGNFRQGRFSNSSLGGNLSYKTKKLAYSLSLGLDDYNWWQELKDDRTFIKSGLTYKLQGNSFLKMPTQSVNYTAGLEYILNTKNSLDFKITNGINQSNGSANGKLNTQFPQMLAQNVSSTNAMTELSKSLTGIVGYKYANKGKEFVAEFVIADSKTDGTQDLKSTFATSAVKSRFTNQKNIQSSGADFKSISLNYSLPVKEKYQFETGIKINRVGNSAMITFDTLTNFDKQTFTKDNSRSNKFLFDEGINMGFMQLSRQFKKLSMVLGIRAENTLTNGRSVTIDSTVKRNFWNILPTATFQYKIDDKNSLSLASTSKLSRPGVWALNPFPFFVDQYTYALGNPFLRPTVRNNFEINYTHKSSIFTISHSLIQNDISQLMIFDEKTNASNWQQYNVKLTNNTQASFYSQYNIKKWWVSQIWTGLSFGKMNTLVQGQNAAVQGFAYSLWNQHTFTLPKGWNFETSISYAAPSKASYYQNGAMYNWSAGLQKSFLKGKMNFQVYMNDILYTNNFVGKMILPGTTNNFSNIGDSRWLRVRLSYNFGKSTFQGSNRKSNADDAARIKK